MNTRKKLIVLKWEDLLRLIGMNLSSLIAFRCPSTIHLAILKPCLDDREAGSSVQSSRRQAARMFINQRLWLVPLDNDGIAEANGVYSCSMRRVQAEGRQRHWMAHTAKANTCDN